MSLGCGNCDHCDVTAVIPATLDALEQVFKEFRHRCRCLYDKHDWFVAELLLRELLTNAVVHGSHKNPALSVRCTMRMGSHRLLLAVIDEGEGFDWRRIRTHQAGPSAVSGRGMEILQKYATQVRFNKKGNAVIIVRKFGGVTRVGDSNEELMQ